MIVASGYNDTLRIYYSTQRDNVGYNLAYIGSDFTKTLPAPFDQGHMRALFDYGFDQGPQRLQLGQETTARWVICVTVLRMQYRPYR